MEMRPEDIERWLASEDRGDDPAAEMAFASLLAAVPRVEPQSGFVERTRATAWRSCVRGQVRAPMARAAALVLAITGGAVASGLAVLYAGPLLLVSGAGVASRSFGGIVTGAVAGLEWWMTGARMAVVIGETFGRGEAAGVVFGVEVVGVLALYALRQLIRGARATGAWREVRT